MAAPKTSSPNCCPVAPCQGCTSLEQQHRGLGRDEGDTDRGEEGERRERVREEEEVKDVWTEDRE